VKQTATQWRQSLNRLFAFSEQQQFLIAFMPTGKIFLTAAFQNDGSLIRLEASMPLILTMFCYSKDDCIEKDEFEI
jgi:hypothetical protein